MTETTITEQVRVATLNLWGRRGAWDERRPLLAEELLLAPTSPGEITNASPALNSHLLSL